MPAFIVVLVLLFGVVWPADGAATPRPVASPLFQSPWQQRVNPTWQEATRAYYRGELAEAAATLSALLEEEGIDEVGVRLDLAVMYREMGALHEAAAQYERLAQILPDDPAVAGAHAWSVMADGRAEEALSLFDRARQLSPDDPWAHLGAGLALEALGRREEAAAAYAEATVVDPDFALAWDRLGLLRHEAGEWAPAVEAMERALRLDANYTHLIVPLAEAYAELGRPQDAWTYYERASRVHAGDDRVQEAVTRFVAQHQELVERLERAKEDARRRITHARVEVPAKRGGQLIRVGLVEGADRLRLSAGGAFEAGGRTFSAGQWHVESVESGLRLVQGDQHVTFATQELRLHLVDETTTWIALGLDAGRGYFWSREEDLQVRGDLIVLVRPAGLTLINELDIEEYLLAVVPSEMYASMPMEALKAQAIAARTYTLRNLGRYGQRGFDVMGSVLSSAYRGVDRETPRTTEAVQATHGLVLLFNGRLIDALYHSNAGGFTTSNAIVWAGTPLPYLPSAPEWPVPWTASGQPPSLPFSPIVLENWLRHTPEVYSQGTGFGGRSTFRWVMPVSAERILERLGGSQGLGRIVAVTPGPRDAGGWIASVTVMGTEGSRVIQANVMRSRLGGLRSGAFTVYPLHGEDGLPHTFIFVGAGFGHGVGLSQAGAAGMAQRGATVEDILARYYQGATITPNYGLSQTGP